MSVKVLDASALAALLFGEPTAQDIADRLGDAQLIAPALLFFKVASVCLKKIRRNPDMRNSLLEAFAFGERLTITHVDVAFRDVIPMAEESGLTFYDASYLWLARTLGAELVTLDRRLAHAAGQQ